MISDIEQSGISVLQILITCNFRVLHSLKYKYSRSHIYTCVMSNNKTCIIFSIFVHSFNKIYFPAMGGYSVPDFGYPWKLPFWSWKNLRILTLPTSTNPVKYLILLQAVYLMAGCVMVWWTVWTEAMNTTVLIIMSQLI